MTCTPFQLGELKGIICEDGYHAVFDGKRTWRWTEGGYGGPWLVDRRGRDLRRQPGARSRFWPVWDAYWQTKQ